MYEIIFGRESAVPERLRNTGVDDFIVVLHTILKYVLYESISFISLIFI
jgi:hypothetical protein